jgi:alkylation response protein AidB-like acyl-CoA dehydrogenase
MKEMSMTTTTTDRPDVADLRQAQGNDFAAGARAWLAANFPPELVGHSSLEYQTPEQIAAAGEPYARWQRAMADSGFGVPTWPAEYGGGGLDSQQARILSAEMARAQAFNPIGGMGVMMFGPTLLEYGDEVQKRTHIPPICRGELRWCQGFSEPGAGSDLASLKTRCEDKGDHWLINGSKIWTSGAHMADWCFCLVRTDTSKKQEGISFILIDMKTPGVEVRPIKLISGSSPFCETFFTDVKVPKENLVGTLNGGWKIGKRLLQHERASLSSGGRRAGPSTSLSDQAKRYVGADAEGRLADPELRARLARHMTRQRAYMLTLQRIAAESRGGGPSTTTSIIKNVNSRLAQERAELSIEFMGSQGLGSPDSESSAQELGIIAEWLSGKAYSIYGGSQEIQNNIVSKHILNLPDR